VRIERQDLPGRGKTVRQKARAACAPLPGIHCFWVSRYHLA
jgi:hypothetical protein